MRPTQPLVALCHLLSNMSEEAAELVQGWGGLSGGETEERGEKENDDGGGLEGK